MPAPSTWHVFNYTLSVRLNTFSNAQRVGVLDSVCFALVTLFKIIHLIS